MDTATGAVEFCRLTVIVVLNFHSVKVVDWSVTPSSLFFAPLPTLHLIGLFFENHCDFLDVHLLGYFTEILSLKIRCWSFGKLNSTQLGFNKKTIADG